MDLDALAKALKRWWYVPPLLVALALAGAWTYNNLTSTNTAVAKLAVQSAPPPPGEFIPAQIPFDNLDESRELAERIAARLDDGTTPDQVAQAVSIRLRRSNNRSPIYTIEATHPQKERAILIANLALEEAVPLYAEINHPEPRNFRAAFKAETDRAEAEVTSSRASLDQFLAENDAHVLPQRLSQQLGLVSQLTMQSHSANAATSSSQTTVTAIEEALNVEQEELSRLMALNQEHGRLQKAVAKAESEQSSLEQRVLEIIVAQTLPIQSNLKVLDTARIQSNLWFISLMYILAAALGSFVSLTIIYFLAYFETTAPNVQEFEQAIGRPVIALVPKQQGKEGSQWS